MENICGHGRFFYARENPIGRGAEGQIYQACSKNQLISNKRCSHVVKKLKSGASTIVDEMAAFFGIGPRVFPERCEKETYLIQQRLDGTLDDYIQSLPKKKLTDHDMKLLSHLVYDSIDTLHVFHHDLHSENIMYTKDPHGHVRFYLIDFSTATPLSDIGYTRFDSLLNDHRYITFHSDETRLPILNETQVETLSKKYRPPFEYSQHERRQRQKRQRVRQQQRRRVQQDIKKRLARFSVRSTTHES